MRPAGLVLTFVCVAISMVAFRSQTMEAATGLFHGMLGLNGIALPASIHDRLGPLAGWLHIARAASSAGGDVDLRMMAAWIAALSVVAFACPNTLQLLGRYEPALGWKADIGATRFWGRPLAWNASLPWAMVISVLATAAILHLGGQSEFLYWQF
jgi:hypothetical protein